METPGLASVAERLARDLSAAGRDTPRIHTLVEGAPPRRAVAVDGSNVTLVESGSHLVGALRVAAVLLEDGTRAAPLAVPPPEVVLLTRRDAGATLAERLGVADVEVDLARVPNGAALEMLREHAEHALALRMLDELDAGDLLLLDGALAARPPLPHMTTLAARAAERGVHLVGVCKSTSLTVGNVPAIAACALAARGANGAHGADGMRGAWWAEIAAPPAVRGRVTIARLSRAEDRPFRFDLASPAEPPYVLGMLAALSRHPAQPGYPAPLAMAHHRATIVEDERRRLAAAVRDRAQDLGVREDAWRAAFLDWHDVLELGV